MQNVVYHHSHPIVSPTLVGPRTIRLEELLDELLRQRERLSFSAEPDAGTKMNNVDQAIQLVRAGLRGLRTGGAA